MDIKITKSSEQDYFFDIEIFLKNTDNHIILQLPAWRPGRYEIQNFSKNLQDFKVYNLQDEAINFKKITKDSWQIFSNRNGIIIKYSFYANKTDAGNSFVDNQLYYLNFVNCIPYVVGQMNSPIQIAIKTPPFWKVACPLPYMILEKEGVFLKAKSIYELYDSAFMACQHLAESEYFINENHFLIQIIGDYQPNWEKILPAFKAFSIIQIEVMGDFPVKKYHFIIWVLPTAYYHGVEHGASTVIVLGPDIEGDSLLFDLFGVASHELFHTWNICKIRPIELMPINFTKESYFPTGFVVEGITTYLGDLFLVQSGVITKDEYLKELSAICMRHFLKDGNAKQSIVESSIDLWVDGYTEGIPNKKVSIYNKGALVALVLDLLIRDKFEHTKSIYDCMKYLWENFGKKDIGYSIADFKLVAEKIFEDTLEIYFKMYIYGNEPLEPFLNELLAKIGLQIIKKNKNSIAIVEVKKKTKKQIDNLDKFLNSTTLGTI
jgi:predicted metalloprotease with PDZ domain